ncbi:MAG TPA: glycosyltransferase [Sphingobium sp.]|uniref:glycosyltransferase n=1 Tax=Sphingobium sp. TaxID=1912891 RepID=UPI002ED0B011
MRIVDVCAFYTPAGGGVKTYVEQKLRAAERFGHEVIILAPGDTTGTLSTTSHGTVETLAGPRFPLDRRYGYFNDEKALHARLDALEPDIVEASSPWGSAAMVARWQGSAPKALIMHADPLSAYAYRWFSPVASEAMIDRGFDWYWRHLRRLDKKFEIIVSASPGLASRLTAGGLHSVETIPMGVTANVFSPDYRDEGLRQRLLERCELGPEALLLLGVGRHAPEKRWPMVIDAVQAASYDRPIGLVIIGDGRHQARVVKAVSHNPHIHLMAPTSDRAMLARLYASADALVHGCEAETFGMCAAEALASGTPIIVPDSGGSSDQCREGMGEHYKARDGASLADAIRRFSDNGRDHYLPATLDAAAHTRTEEDHFRALFSTYEDILARDAQPWSVRA